MKKKIMVFCDFYLPGFKSGGGMWTVVNLVEQFKDRFDFFIVTRNHDGKGDKRPYDNVETGAWYEVQDAMVYYFGKEGLSSAKSASLVSAVQPDLVFLNSSMSIPAVSFLRARKKTSLKRIPVILASCGEMASEALAVKPLKKRAFLSYASLTGLYQGVLWKASTEDEENEIRSTIGKRVDVMIAADLTPISILPDYQTEWKPPKRKGSVRFCTLSRLIPSKNVHYFLERLSEISDGDIHFDIIGPAEEPPYLQQLEGMIANLPGNLKVTMAGPMPNRDALRRMCEGHFFASATKSENFGYVFVEAMAAGCPLLVSDRNIWNDLDEKSLGWRIPLEQPERFVERIRSCIDMEQDEFNVMSAASREFALEWLANPSAKQANAQVIERALSSGVPPK